MFGTGDESQFVILTLSTSTESRLDTVEYSMPNTGWCVLVWWTLIIKILFAKTKIKMQSIFWLILNLNTYLVCIKIIGPCRPNPNSTYDLVGHLEVINLKWIFIKLYLKLQRLDQNLSQIHILKKKLHIMCCQTKQVKKLFKACPLNTYKNSFGKVETIPNMPCWDSVSLILDMRTYTFWRILPWWRPTFFPFKHKWKILKILSSSCGNSFRLILIPISYS